MNKKILVAILLIVILIGLFVLTGCETKKESKDSSNNKSSSIEEASLQAKEIEVEGIKFKLDKEDSFGNSFKYKYSSSFKEDYLGTTRFYSLLNQDGNEIIEIRVNSSYTTPQQVLVEKESNYSNDNTANVKTENKVMNSKEWVYIEYTNTQKEKNYTNHEFYYNFGDEYCVIQFRIDSSVNDLNGINGLEQEFINNVSFN